MMNLQLYALQSILTEKYLENYANDFWIKGSPKIPHYIAVHKI